GKQQNTDGKRSASPCDQAPLNLCGQQRYTQQSQGVHQLVGDASVEDRQVFRRQPVFQAMGGERAKGNASEAEKSGQHQKATQHEELQSDSINRVCIMARSTGSAKPSLCCVY